MKNTIIASLLVAGIATTVSAQSGTNSPYSQFGLGILSDQATGFNRGMNGVGIAFHEADQVNCLNPASYAAVDSLTFLFDMGASGQLTNFKEGNVSRNAKNADFEYAVGLFRAARNVGVSFGIIPFTNIGYNYSSSSKVGGSTYTTTTTYSGEGGLHEVYLGAGWQPIKGLSVGANIAYLWGSYTKSSSVSFSDSYANPSLRSYTATIYSYKLDFGAQYTYQLDKKNALSLGVTYSPGHSIGGNPRAIIGTTNTMTSTTTYDTLSTVNGSKLSLKIPTAVGVGVMWNRDNRIKVGVDYTYQNWGSLEEPMLLQQGGNTYYSMQSGQYMDRHKFNVGCEITPQPMARGYFKRIRYRAGAAYTTPYYKVNGADGPKEYSASLGFGFPISDNMYKRTSYLNISGQWVHTDGLTMRENTFRINIGFTFNGRWFEKWKAE